MLHCKKCGAQLQRPEADCVDCLRHEKDGSNTALADDIFVEVAGDDDDDVFVDIDDWDTGATDLDDSRPDGAAAAGASNRWSDAVTRSKFFKYAAPEADPVDPEAQGFLDTPTPDPISELISGPVSESVAEPASEPVADSTSPPVDETGPDPFGVPQRAANLHATLHAALHPVIEPISGEVARPVRKPITADEPAAEPAAASVAEPIADSPREAVTGEQPDLDPDDFEDMVVVTPFSESTEAVTVTVTPRYEVHSAPGQESPAVHVLLDLEPFGQSLVNAAESPIAHVILALDLSASMNHARKYPVLTRALENMLNDLRSSDEGDVLVSLVVYAYGAEVLLKAAPASEINAREVLTLVDNSKLRFGRYTDIVGALSRGGRIALDSHRAMPRVPIRMYVLTDGKPQDMGGARKIMTTIRKLPVDVHGLAFGDDADVDALQQLISGGRGGTIKHVRPDTLESAFERIAEVARRVVAKRSLLEVELRDGVVGGAAYRFRPGRHAYGGAAFAGGRTFNTDLGTLERGRKYSLLLQLRLPPSEDASTELGRVSLRIPGEGGPVTFECLLSIDRHPGKTMPTADPAVTEVRHVVEAVSDVDPNKQLLALKARRKLYVEERRDPYIIDLIDKAIEQMTTSGSLELLSDAERAALQSHTRTVVDGGTTAKAVV